MQIGRRQFMAGAASMAFLGSVGRAGAQSTTLSAPWMGWPEEQVTPLMEAFEKATGIKVSAERLPIAELFKTLEVRLQARNELPDVYLVDGPLTASYAARGHLLDLDEMLSGDLDRFVPTTL
ncbi:MAG: extracellular solute-binding protein, partial [Rhizobiaceae bacterium]|nr:extracellular solute-binding protein [Rhizobiaceae bacterium]